MDELIKKRMNVADANGWYLAEHTYRKWTENFIDEDNGNAPIWISGKSKRAVELEGKLKAREGLIDNLNKLREKEQKEICELYAHIDILNEKLSARQVRSNKRKQ